VTTISNVIETKFSFKPPFEGFTQSIVEFFRDGTNQVKYSSGLSFEEYCSTRPDEEYILVSSQELGELMEGYENSLVTAPVEISKERFTHALEVLPPCRWRDYGLGNAFHISERNYGSNVNWYVEKFGKYYTFSNSDKLSDEQVASIISKI